MTPDDFIPVGRTSLAKSGPIFLQVQTEYASRPYPRITTTILDSGQVLHKVERKLEHAVESFDERAYTENTIQQQHNEVLALIEKNDVKPNEGSVLSEPSKRAPQSVYDRLISIPGFRHVYRLNVDGIFTSKNTAKQFKKAFAAVFKNLQQVIQVFPLMPGTETMRQKGVCEVERNSLYFVSNGSECYFVAVNPPGKDIDYEAVLKQVLLISD